MIIKLINCQVKPQLKKQFSRGQRQWQNTNSSSGFIGQTGGWQQDDANNPKP